MSYTSIIRYWGDEAKTKKNQSDGYQDLLAKIEERKKQRAVQKIQVQSSAEEQELPEDKKVGKRDVGENENLKQEFSTTELPPKKLKLSNKKSVREPESSLIESITEKSEVPPVVEESSQNDVESSNFTIIKGLEPKKALKVKRVLPSWLANPTVVSVDLKNLSTSIQNIPDLDKSLIDLLERNKVTHFFPVQSQLIPWLLKFHEKCKQYWPRDVCVSAPTGSGKTLAFVLPIIQLLKTRFIRDVRALVVLPTKDLSFQVYKVFKQYLIGTNLKAMHLGNGTLEKEKYKIVAEDEIRGYRSLVDIIVTTPGRLVEHLKYTPGLSLSNLRFLVIDEADHVMDSVQNDWLTHLQTRIPPFSKNLEAPYLTLSNVKKRPPRTQKLLFSATLSQDPEKLKQLNLFQPCLFTSVVKSEDSENTAQFGIEKSSTEFIGKFSTPAELNEFYTVCPLSIKPLVLYHIIRMNNWRRILCFADSVANVHKLNTLLNELNKSDEDGVTLKIVEISSKLTTSVHRGILEQFSKNNIDILVTTDALARGIDLQNVDYVILYDAPKYVKNYIHRIGRTGRAGHKGTSLVLITPDQKEHFDNILRTAGKTNVPEIPVSISDVRHLETIYKSALDALKTNMESEKFEAIKKNNHKNFKRKRKRKD